MEKFVIATAYWIESCRTAKKVSGSYLQWLDFQRCRSILTEEVLFPGAQDKIITLRDGHQALKPRFTGKFVFSRKAI
jgi:hypothetical protein